MESEVIADIAKQFVQENIIPESLKFAPWVKEGFYGWIGKLIPFNSIQIKDNLRKS